MAIVLLLNVGSRVRPSLEISLDGSESVVFRRVDLNGRTQLALQTEDERLLGHFRENPAYRVLEERSAAAPSPASVSTSVSVSVSLPANLGEASPATLTEQAAQLPVAQARRNGWSIDDLVGAGRNDEWGQAGGRSFRTGLTMAEMALCVPPDEWASEAATRYPWDLLKWVPPGPGWKPPTVPAKTAEAASPTPTPTPVAQAQVPGNAPDEFEGDEEAAAKAPQAKNTRPRSAAVAGGGASPGTRSDVPMTDEQLESARRLLAEVTAAAQKPPALQKANYHLQRNGLPAVNKAALDFLLS